TPLAIRATRTRGSARSRPTSARPRWAGRCSCARRTSRSRRATPCCTRSDSVWLKRAGATRTDYEALARGIVEATGLPIAVEGVYRWIAFVPSRTHPLVGVPNRYFGVFEDGTEKVRGLELRRGDAPPIVAAMQ